MRPRSDFDRASLGIVLACASYLALASCSSVEDIGGGAGLNLTWLDDATFGYLTIGEVFVCEDYVDPPLELCWVDTDSAELATSLDEYKPAANPWACHATPRHAGPCDYHCSGAGAGCNAFDGCWCQ